MDIDTGVQQDSPHPAGRFNEKECLQACGGMLQGQVQESNQIFHL
jgi:hypothetical protein